MRKGAGAVLFAGVLVAGYAAWSQLRARERAPRFVVYPAAGGGDDSGAEGVNAADWLNYGKDSSSPANPLISWGIDTLFDALGRAGQGGQGVVLPSRPDRAPVTPKRPKPTPGRGGVKGLFAVITGAEAPGGYDTIYGGAKVRPKKPITKMTVAEVRQFQRRMKSSGSTAVGQYQVMGYTLDDMIKKGVVKPSDRYDASTQDRIATHLLERRGLSAYRAGKISETQFALNLSKEWAGLPVPYSTKGHVRRVKAGESYYTGLAGNRATTSIDSVLSAIRGL